jgi:hypothetical protein
VRSKLKDKTESIKSEDDTLFGLLSAHKAYNTYFRILINEENNNLLLQITGNPKKWPAPADDRYKDYRQLKRSELGTTKLSVKYLSPEHLIEQLGPDLGIKVPANDVSIANNLDADGFYSLELKSKYLQEIIQVIEKIIELSPERKYELLEKSFSKNI